MKNTRWQVLNAGIILGSLLIPYPLCAEEESNNRLAKGAMVGAGTNVIGGAVLDSLDGSSQPQYVQVQGPDGQMYWQQVNTPQEDPNKLILKRAVQGAVTGAVAAEFSKDDGGKKSGDSGAFGGIADALTKKSSSQSDEDNDEDDYDDEQGKKHKHKKSKEGWRPPGWDRGKKVGWGGGDVPPGHQDREEEKKEDTATGNWFTRLFGNKD